MGETIKKRNFVTELMSNKTVGKVPGIGAVSAEKLNVAGFNKAYKLFGQYLILGKNEDNFKQWLKTTTEGSCNATSIDECYDALKVWDSVFFS